MDNKLKVRVKKSDEQKRDEIKMSLRRHVNAIRAAARRHPAEFAEVAKELGVTVT